MDYKIIVKNTGDTELILSGFTDVKCTNLAGGASRRAVGTSTTWTCEHELAAPGKYSNVASVEASEAVLRERCDGPYGEPTKCDSDKRYEQDHKHGSYSKRRFLGKKKSDMVTVDVTTTTTTSTTESSTATAPTTTTTSAIPTETTQSTITKSSTNTTTTTSAIPTTITEATESTITPILTTTTASTTATTSTTTEELPRTSTIAPT